MSIRPQLIIVLLTFLVIGNSSAALFTSKETKAYKKLRDAARRALKARDFGLAKTNFLAAHEALSSKRFKNYYYKGSLIDLASFFYRRGQPDLSEPYLATLRDYEVGRRGTNHLGAALAYFVHGQVQKGLYQFQAAEESLLRADYTVRWKVGKYSVEAGYTKAVLGQLYVWMKRDAEAIQNLEIGLRQMGKMRRSKEYEFGGYEIEVRESTFRPDLEDVAELLIDYSVALEAVGRTKESETAVKQAVEYFGKKHSSANAVFRAYMRLGSRAEARRELAAAERLFYRAADIVWKAENLTDEEKLRGNELLFDFHIRNGQDSKANQQERILFEAGVSDDRILALTIRSEELMRARSNDEEQE